MCLSVLAFGSRVVSGQSIDIDERWTIIDRLVTSGRYAEAAPEAEQVLELVKARYGEDHKLYTDALNNLAMIYTKMGRADKAGPLLSRAKRPPSDMARVETQSNTFDVLKEQVLELYNQRKYSEAIPLARQLVELATVHFPETDILAEALHNLGYLYFHTQQVPQAASPLEQAYALREKLLPEHHEYRALTGHLLADLKYRQGHLDEAELLYRKALPKRAEMLGPDSPRVMEGRSALLEIYIRRKNWSAALTQVKEVNRGFRDRWGRVAPDSSIMGEALRAQVRGELYQFRAHHLLEIWLAHAVGGLSPSLVAESFSAAQLSTESMVNAALERTAVRFGPRTSPRLKDLVHQRAKLEAERIHIFSTNMLQAGSRVSELEHEIKNIAQQLANEFPPYSALLTSEPVSLSIAQSLLEPDEALILFLDTPGLAGIPGATFAWAITKTEAKWIHLEVGTHALAHHVAELRCGLDASAWIGPLCSQRFGKDHDPSDTQKPLPFDLARGHELYNLLLGQLTTLINGKKYLFIVPSGPLTSLPFHVLVTESRLVAIPNDFSEYRDVPWLARRHAITTLPSVASLRALREFARTSKAKNAYVAFGNPLLDGKPGSAAHARLASRARAQQLCRLTDRQVALSGIPPAVGDVGIHSVLRRGEIDRSVIKELPPLPDTADEVCEAATILGASEPDVHLGAATTESRVKAMSKTGRLRSYRVLHFATHGLIAAETERLGLRRAEPALVMTPPERPGESDDGLLMASEVAALELDADWVILSACNTAAGQHSNGEALSGLARAFFYAGARTLLVSHWYVDSAASKLLVSTMLKSRDANTKTGRAESLRLAMIHLMTLADPKGAHPANWAPFVVVGEGSRE
jgi:CHAT domain-containing protein/tetratricopeptide (TPR) repeat protein